MKLLFLDVETAPDLVYTWGVYQENALAVRQHWQLLSFSAKWRGGKHITRGLSDHKGYKPGCSDKKLVQEVWDLLDAADVVVAHNGVDFDFKRLNARFIVHGMKPPAPYKAIDTKRELKHVAAFSSNKLDWLCKQLEIGSKIEHEGFQLWLDCMSGNKNAWQKMLRYNHHDVELLEELYERLTPWIRQPNAGLYLDGDKPRCVNPMCGSHRLERRGTARSRTRLYARFCCKDCGAWGRSTKSEGGVNVTGIDRGVV